MGKCLTRGLFAGFIVIIALGFIATAVAEEKTLGILNQPAPEWGVAQWFHLPEDKTRLDIGDFKGKVVYLYCFQSW